MSCLAQFSGVFLRLGFAAIEPWACAEFAVPGCGAAIADFGRDPPTTIFLLTTRSGAVGINLTAANHVFLLEPALNPALEEQAIGRAWRMGQKRPVVVKRLFVKVGELARSALSPCHFLPCRHVCLGPTQFAHQSSQVWKSSSQIWEGSRWVESLCRS